MCKNFFRHLRKNNKNKREVNSMKHSSDSSKAVQTKSLHQKQHGALRNRRRNPSSFDGDGMIWGQSYFLNDFVPSTNSMVENEMFHIFNAFFYEIINSLHRIDSSFKGSTLRNKSTVSFHNYPFEDQNGFEIIPLGNPQYYGLMEDVIGEFGFIHIKISIAPETNFFDYIDSSFQTKNVFSIKENITNLDTQILRLQYLNGSSQMLESLREQKKRENLLIVDFQRVKSSHFCGLFLLSMIDLARQLQGLELNYYDPKTGRLNRSQVLNLLAADDFNYEDEKTLRVIYDGCTTLIHAINYPSERYSLKEVIKLKELSLILFSSDRHCYNLSNIVRESLSIIDMIDVM